MKPIRESKHGKLLTDKSNGVGSKHQKTSLTTGEKELPMKVQVMMMMNRKKKIKKKVLEKIIKFF